MRSLTIALLLCLSVAMMFGQAPAGTISGAVFDQQGAAVAGATVTATNQETKVDYTTKTAESGAFLFPSLPPATYTLVLEQPGFKKYIQTNLILPNNAAISAGEVKLEIGQVSQSVEVAARGEQLQTHTAEQATSVTTRQIENTTVAGRSPLALLMLVPGMYTDGDFSTDNNQTGNIYSNGARATQFNVQLNGASNLDTGSKTKMMATVSLDMVQEFRVLTSNFDARYGLNAGAQIMMVTKSGSRTSSKSENETGYDDPT
jgi:hypothetical protein